MGSVRNVAKEYPARRAESAMLPRGAPRSTRFLAAWAAFWLVIVASPAATARQGQCCGKLRVMARAESADKRPIAGVTVELYPARPGPGLAFETDRRGFGAQVGVPEGTYRARLAHPDFMTVEITDIVVRSWPTVELTVSLPPRIAGRPNIIRRMRYRSPLIDTDGGSIRYVIRN
ncbi:MAG: hypothetical protein CFK52_03225 [Chloracidobacterium sp. CP2_5A]|nr:MAG: hypothetical protein CFK52_03225 [Chloracidobacterium sp. CP2_5A]